jgi:hypothetical protein
MAYCFMNRTGPDCPAGTSFLLLADHPQVPSGIFDVNTDGAWSPPDPVGESLARLIESGKRYPPALALARSEVQQVFGDDRPSREDFARAYETALKHHLSRQFESCHVMARAAKDEQGYLIQGEWYWVLEISGNPALAAWVSRDFRICDSDMNVFDLTGQQLKRLGYSG